MDERRSQADREALCLVRGDWRARVCVDCKPLWPQRVWQSSGEITAASASRIRQRVAVGVIGADEEGGKNRETMPRWIAVKSEAKAEWAESFPWFVMDPLTG